MEFPEDLKPQEWLVVLTLVALTLVVIAVFLISTVAWIQTAFKLLIAITAALGVILLGSQVLYGLYLLLRRLF